METKTLAKCLLIKVALKKSGAGYELDLMALKPAAGFYELTVSAEPAKPNKADIGAIFLI